MINYFRAFCYLYGMMKRAYWNRDRLIEYQNKRLRKIIKYAYDYVPFYHRKFRKLGIKPVDVKTEKDLNKLPILRKDEIRKNLDEMISKEFTVGDLKMLSTSGSTGQPLFLYMSDREDEFRKAKHLRANISCGQKLRDRWVTITSPRHLEEHMKLQQMLCIYVPTPVSVFSDVTSQLSIIEKKEPDVLDGYSSSLLLLAQEVEKRELVTIRPRFIISGAELIDDSARRYIEKVFDAPVYDQYACIEMERIAWQCPQKMGYHMDADAMLVQFVDENREEISSEKRGEIVCTSFFNYAMPLIRYAVGDMGIPSDEECSCGRTLPLMKAVEGRKDSLLILPNGRVLSPRSFTIAVSTFRLYRYIDQFRVVQRKIDLFEVQIKKRDDTVEEKNMATELEAHLRRMLGINLEEVTFKIRFVEDIPLDKSGKLMIVVSELKRPFDLSKS